MKNFPAKLNGERKSAKQPETGGKIDAVSNNEKPLILLTNDDGIRSPGLWSAAEALSEIGYVTVAAPREQASGSGRSMPPTSEGTIRKEKVQVRGQEWTVYAVAGSPAQTVQHAIIELMPRVPDLVVAGINYGENVTTSITISGTVGAAMEGAAFGAPAMAVSLETDREHHLSYSEVIDFAVAAQFAQRFGRLILEQGLPPGVDFIKIDVPAGATPDTPWQVTHLERSRYYVPKQPAREGIDQPGRMDYEVVPDFDHLEHGSDAQVLRVQREVSVTPLTLDMTANVDRGEVGSMWENGLAG